ncbi:hypothetical protein [Streptomyces sp. NPDC057403]|uniref:hypothetical protein n=1 Tax=Streptomyces sp. NPDC057403 TaxID=3346119 RepID=UPI0036939494
MAVEHCLFHPQDGGQPADRGWVDGHEITPVRDHGSGLVLAVAHGGTALPVFSVGRPVEVRIDLSVRLAHAALHTAGHLSEAAGRAQGWVPAAGNHFPGQARIEFTAPTPDARLDTPEGREEATAALGTWLKALPAADLLHAVEANLLFCRLPQAVIDRLLAEGFTFYHDRWEPGVCRFVTS